MTDTSYIFMNVWCEVYRQTKDPVRADELAGYAVKAYERAKR